MKLKPTVPRAVAFLVGSIATALPAIAQNAVGPTAASRFTERTLPSFSGATAWLNVAATPAVV